MAKTDPTFQHPSEIKAKEERVPVSARVPKEVDRALDNYSKEHGIPKATLIEHAVLAYWKWLQKSVDQK